MKIIKYAKILRKNQTPAENRLWYFLRAHRYKDLKFKRQKPIGNYIADFVCLELKLIIEIDGSQHFMQRNYDTQRTYWLEAKGFCVLRFWNNQVMREIEGVLEAIDEKIKTLSCPE